MDSDKERELNLLWLAAENHLGGFCPECLRRYLDAQRDSDNDD